MRALTAFTFIVFSASFAGAYEAVVVRDGASISGKVVFRGKVPEPLRLLITKDGAVCGEGYVERREVSVSRDGGLKDVVVVFEAIAKGKPWQAPAGGYVLDQKACEFRPYLQVIPQGAELLILNSDPVLHNVHAHELIGPARRTLFNIAQPKVRPKVTRTMKTTRGKAIRIECDAHNWMVGWLYLADNPYFAVLGEDGTFGIRDIPPGSYKLKAWHPFLGTQEKEVNLSAKGSIDVVFEFK